MKTVRSLSLCAWCRWGNTHDTETWCSSDKFEIKQGSNNWPDITKCDEFNVDKKVTPSDLAWFEISHAASEIKRLQVKSSLMSLAKNP